MKKVILLLLLCVALLTGCSSKPKQAKEIASDLASENKYFQRYDLKIDEYAETKRQTNKEDKTDYVWFTIKGSNSEFEYTADYEAIYVLYNDGWLLEEYKLVNSHYKAIAEFDPSEFEAGLSKKYQNISLVDRHEGENKSTLCYSAEMQEELYTKYYEITVAAEYEPGTWDVVDVDYNETKRELNILGEWIYEDNAGRYYYMHVSESHGDTATINYYFVNTLGTDEWNYISSDGYREIDLGTYYSKYTGVDEDTLYFHLKNKSGLPSGMGGDINFGWLWLEKTLFVDGKTFCGFTINEKYLTRMNNSVTPIIGLDDTKKPFSVNNPPANLTDEERVVEFVNNGDINGALSFISSLSKKTEACLALETKIATFQEEYGDLLGWWVRDYGSDPEEFLLTCRYENEIILCLEMGETIEGEKRLHDLVQIDNDWLVFHSDRFDSNMYHFLYHHSGKETLQYYWKTDDGLKQIKTDYIKK